MALSRPLIAVIVPFLLVALGNIGTGSEEPPLFWVRGNDTADIAPQAVQMELEPVPVDPEQSHDGNNAFHQCPTCDATPAEFGCADCGEPAHGRRFLGNLLNDGGPTVREKLGEAYWGAKVPLQGTSWLNRPLHADGFFGVMMGDDLIAGRVGQNSGTFGGFRFGWDTDTYWGVETRLGFATLDLDYSDRGDSEANSDLMLADFSILYYPFGDARWRPYFGVGLGMVNVYAQDDRYDMHDDTVVGVPIGVGVKYYHSNWLALRLDLMDNVALGAGEISSMSNISLTAGFEYRFGGRRPSYWPWNPGSYVR